VLPETIMTRIGVDRIRKYAFDLAQNRPRRHLTSATKSNGISISMPCWDERVEAMATSYPDVEVDKYHIDILNSELRDAPAPSASHRARTSTRNAASPASSNPCTVPLLTSPAAPSPTQSAKSVAPA